MEPGQGDGRVYVATAMIPRGLCSVISISSFHSTSIDYFADLTIFPLCYQMRWGSGSSSTPVGVLWVSGPGV